MSGRTATKYTIAARARIASIARRMGIALMDFPWHLRHRPEEIAQPFCKGLSQVNNNLDWLSNNQNITLLDNIRNISPAQRWTYLSIIWIEGHNSTYGTDTACHALTTLVATACSSHEQQSSGHPLRICNTAGFF